MRIAMSTNDIADWDATLNDAIDRCDTPAICRSRLNRIQCSLIYSVDSAIIEARESLPFILNAKQYSFYFSTYNTFISGLFKQRRFDAREEATTMFETAQQVKQPVGIWRWPCRYKAACIINSACTTKPSIAGKRDRYMSHLREWWEPSTLHLGRSLRMALHDRPEGERHRTHIPLRRQLRRPRQMERRAWERDPTGHYPVTSRSLQALSFLKKGQIKEARRLLDEAARFIHPQIPPTLMSIFTRLVENYGKWQEITKGLSRIWISCWRPTRATYLSIWTICWRKRNFWLIPEIPGPVYHALSYVYTGERLANRLDIASRMDQLRTIYEVDRLNQERQYARNWMFAAFTGCLLLSFC